MRRASHPLPPQVGEGRGEGNTLNNKHNPSAGFVWVSRVRPRETGGDDIGSGARRAPRAKERRSRAGRGDRIMLL